jgi:hypothetical protein
LAQEGDEVERGRRHFGLAELVVDLTAVMGLVVEDVAQQSFQRLLVSLAGQVLVGHRAAEIALPQIAHEGLDAGVFGHPGDAQAAKSRWLAQVL